MLNISVDSVDTNPCYQPEDLTVNDQESLVEIFLEKFLGFENVITERDEHDTDNQSGKNTTNLDLLAHVADAREKHSDFYPDDLRAYGDHFARTITRCFERDTPPPEA